MKYTYSSANLHFTTDMMDSPLGWDSPRWYAMMSPLRIRTPWFYLRIGRW